MTPVIALSLLAAYLLVSGEVFLATAVRSVFKMSLAGIGPTELRISLVVGALALRRDPHVDLGVLGRLPLFDVGGLVAIAGSPPRSSSLPCRMRVRWPSSNYGQPIRGTPPLAIVEIAWRVEATA